MAARTGPGETLRAALELAAAGVPVLPLRAGKVPFGNCPACARCACGGRPNMLAAGPCACPRPCHAWAAATTHTTVLESAAWARSWREAGAIAYHPGGASLTVLDLDDADAVAWARATLPPTRVVPTDRGEHWIYTGTMRSHNRVRPGVDIKSAMSYARWLGPGTGPMTRLPDAVRALPEPRKETTPRGVVSAGHAAPLWERQVATGCRHTPRYRATGRKRGIAKIRDHKTSGGGSQAFGVARFIAGQHADCPGPCGLEQLAEDLIHAAVSVGVPGGYARRAVERGLQLPGAGSP
ncbi:MAG: DNA primase [Streptosporangiales bacterium]|nr:DNA primase [Streptosporangiales bacterium]